MISFEGGHNSVRPAFFHTSVCIFLANVLGPFAQRSPDRTGSGAGPALAGSPLPLPSPRDHLAASLEGSPLLQVHGHPLSPNGLQYTDEMLLQEALALSLMESTR